jgi:hypothetical protein
VETCGLTSGRKKRIVCLNVADFTATNKLSPFIAMKLWIDRPFAKDNRLHATQI